MQGQAAIELQIRQMEELQQRRLEELANKDPIWQKAQGALEAFRATLTNEAAESEDKTDVTAEEN